MRGTTFNSAGRIRNFAVMEVARLCPLVLLVKVG